jgi:hypothetical protein
LKVSIPGSQELAPNWCRSATTLIIGPIALDPVHRLGEANGRGKRNGEEIPKDPSPPALPLSYLAVAKSGLASATRYLED